MKASKLMFPSAIIADDYSHHHECRCYECCFLELVMLLKNAGMKELAASQVAKKLLGLPVTH